MLVSSISRSRRRSTLGVKGTGAIILPLSVQPRSHRRRRGARGKGRGGQMIRGVNDLDQASVPHCCTFREVVLVASSFYAGASMRWLLCGSFDAVALRSPVT
jgi:hypothetical protein